MGLVILDQNKKLQSNTDKYLKTKGVIYKDNNEHLNVQISWNGRY